MKRMAKFDKILASAAAALITLIVLAFQSTHFMSESRILPIFLTLVLIYAFLTKPLSSKPYLRIIDWILILGSIVTGAYLSINFIEIVTRSGAPEPLDVYMGAAAIVILLEALRRTVGLGLTIIALVFLLYAFFGRYFPDLFRHRGYSLDRVVNQLYLGASGIYGLPLATMFRYVVIFIIFGAILEKTGVSDFMIRVAKAVAGRLPGGTGQVSIVSSGLMGSVSGSAVANVMVGGNVTIPAMKKSGFKGTMAGAIEAVSSNGGQILPPVMGAAAFLMADNLRIPYAQVVLAALIPGILYFLTVMATVHFYSLKNGILGLPKNELPKLFPVLKAGWLYPIPFIVLIWMISAGYSPTYSGLGATIAAILCGFLNKENRLTFKKLYQAIVDAGKGVVMLSIASGGAGMVTGVLTLSGLGNRLASILVDLSQSNLLFLLILAMIGCIILGMGMPTTVVYILLAALVAPALIDMGVMPIAAHLFILYFGTISMLTPPVAMASYAAAAISGDSPDKTGWTGFFIAIPAYIIPFFFVYNYNLLMVGTPFMIVVTCALALLGVFSFAAATMGYLISSLNIVQRILLAVAPFFMLAGDLLFAIIGLALLAGVLVTNRRRSGAANASV